MANDKQPKWKPGVTLRTGIAAHKIALEFREAIEGRLSEGLIDGLGADLGVLRGTTSGVPSARASKKSLTKKQDESAAAGARLVIALRTSVREKLSEDEPAKQAFGVGERFDENVVSSVLGALKTIKDAAEKDTTRSRKGGILPKDLAKLEARITGLGGDDDVQEVSKVTSMEATAARNDAQKRVQAAVGEISVAGGVEFEDDEKVAKRFRKLIPKSSRKGGDGAKTKKEGEGK